MTYKELKTKLEELEVKDEDELGIIDYNLHFEPNQEVTANRNSNNHWEIYS